MRVYLRREGDSAVELFEPVSSGPREVGEQDVHVDQGIGVEVLRSPVQSRVPLALRG